MNDQELLELIKVIEHYRNGGKVQFRARNHNTWYVVGEGFTAWNPSVYEFRVVIPRTLYCLEFVNGEFGGTYSRRDVVERLKERSEKGCKIITLTEVIDE